MFSCTLSCGHKVNFSVTPRSKDQIYCIQCEAPVVVVKKEIIKK